AMAVIRWIPGLEVTIHVGTTAQEYEEPHPEGITREEFDLPANHGEAMPYIVKYIEAKPGARYSFHVTKRATFRGRGQHIAYDTFCDGKKSTSLSHEPNHNQGRKWKTSTAGIWSGNPTAGYKNHKFMFAAFDIVDLPSGNLELQRSTAQQSGVLKVRVYNMQQSILEDMLPVMLAPDFQDAKLAEKAAKGKTVDSFTTYLTTPGTPPPSKCQVKKYTDPKGRPFAVFEFRYRTKEGLMREGIIPRPSIAEQVQGMSEDELRQQLTRLMEQNTACPIPPDTLSFTHEAADIDDSEFMARYKARRLGNGRIEVDLTDD
ncbi:hypothetical protein C8A00DRAFT_14196, partial [Chaetomidium leptoderma]